MSLETYATIRGTAQKLKEMARIASAGYHDDIYMRVRGDEDEVHFLAQTSRRQVMSYCSFSDLKHVEGSAEAIVPVGLDSDTKGYLDYLGIAEGSGTVELRLLGEEVDDPAETDHPFFASHWEAEGALSARVRLPGSQKDLQAVPWGLPDRWTQNDQYLSREALGEDGDIAVDEDEIDQYTLPTHVQTTCGAVRDTIIDPAEFLDGVDVYPIVVEDGEFRLNLQSNEGDDQIEGQVAAEKVEGPDVDWTFDEGFSELFSELSGPVDLYTAPGPDDPDAPVPPLVVTQTNLSGRSIRHVLGVFTEE